MQNKYFKSFAVFALYISLYRILSGPKVSICYANSNPLHDVVGRF